ncbi:RES domain-containing protein [Mesorhizobium sp. M0152]|uniref:RES family NAD+ phosphorylase n=1 Tax=Mesorhizobium sp. M0152 TaxID=2956898 RepID=UPI00333D0B50
MLYRGSSIALNPVYARERLSGRGAELYGGRFNPKAMPVLYASLSVMTALREANEVGNLQPSTLVSYDAERMAFATPGMNTSQGGGDGRCHAHRRHMARPDEGERASTDASRLADVHLPDSKSVGFSMVPRISRLCRCLNCQTYPYDTADSPFR